MRTTVTTTVSRDPLLVPLLDRPDYPGASALLDAADRAWLREHGVEVPDRAAPVPLHEAARQARIQRRTGAAKKKSRWAKKDT